MAKRQEQRPRAFPLLTESEAGLYVFCIDAFSSRKPVATSLENAIAHSAFNGHSEQPRSNCRRSRHALPFAFVTLKIDVTVPSMALVVREMRDYDARAFLEVHHAAVRRLAARDYPAEIIEAWAPLPITSSAVEAVAANPENEIRFVADGDGRLIGLACLVIANNELRACYVAPDVARTGVGKALLMRIEETARNAGVKCLHTDSSVTAEPFYRSQGYMVTKYSHHLLNGRWSMACVKMRKTL